MNLHFDHRPTTDRNHFHVYGKMLNGFSGVLPEPEKEALGGGGGEGACSPGGG